MNLILFDTTVWNQLLPLTYTRPVADLRCGILTIADKWSRVSDSPVSFITKKHLSQKYSSNLTEDNLVVASNVIPSEELWNSISQLSMNEGLFEEQKLIACRLNKAECEELLQNRKGQLSVEGLHRIPVSSVDQIDYPWDIFQKNGDQIKADLKLLKLSSNKADVDDTNTVIGDDIFIEEGAQITAAILNATDGPIYIGRNAHIMEGAIIKGPFALGDSATVKMGAKIYGDTTIGPHCKVGGEVSNVVMHGYSNKGHDGFIGNSVIGEWCNFGADTNSSNLKNNYSPIRVWSYEQDKSIETGLQFCGVIAGDHAKTGINTMLNTGTVLGVSANIFGGDFPPKFVPSFSWGGAHGFDTFRLQKSYEVAHAMMSRRGVDLSEDDKKILEHVFLSDSIYRT